MAINFPATKRKVKAERERIKAEEAKKAKAKFSKVSKPSEAKEESK